MLNQI
jgi:hypothetical protein